MQISRKNISHNKERKGKKSTNRNSSRNERVDKLAEALKQLL